MLTVRMRASLVAMALLVGASTSAWAQAPTLTATVDGGNVTLTWTAVAGATNYGLQGTAQGVPFIVPVGNVTTLTEAPPVGAYQVRIVPVFGATPGTPSNLVSFSITPAPPAAPTNLGAIVSGGGALLSWDLASTTGLTNIVLQVGTSTGGAEVGTIPIGITESLSLPTVPGGNYFLRVFAQAAGGSQSGPSNELQLTVPGCAVSGQIPLKMSNFFGFINIEWPAVPGATGYQLQVSSTLGGGPNLLSQNVPANTTKLTASAVPVGDYYVTVIANLSCGQTATSAQELLKVDQTGGSGPRTPDPPPGQRLPLPNRAGLVDQMANLYRGDLLHSCREHGGNNVWLFRLVQRLRQEDSRWGLNWKRGNRGDMSQDIVTYHFGAGPDEDSTNVYIIDTISGHCGSNPGPNWNDVTEATRRGGTIGRWTLLPFINAGFTP